MRPYAIPHFRAAGACVLLRRQHEGTLSPPRHGWLRAFGDALSPMSKINVRSKQNGKRIRGGINPTGAMLHLATPSQGAFSGRYRTALRFAETSIGRIDNAVEFHATGGWILKLEHTFSQPLVGQGRGHVGDFGPGTAEF